MQLKSIALAVSAMAPLAIHGLKVDAGAAAFPGGSGKGNQGGKCNGKGKLNMYWGQDGSPKRLADYCGADKPDYLTVGFINASPEHDTTGTGYPSMNLAGHCAATFFIKDGKQSKLLDCKTVQEDVAKCQKAGVKILLSIGGVYEKPKNDYSISTEAKGQEFAQFLWDAFGPYNKNSKAPRPFDSGDKRFTVDGFDFDLEIPFPKETRAADHKPWISMVNKLRELMTKSGNSDKWITAAPQCPLSADWFQMDSIISACTFDALFIQFYNNADCDYIDDDLAWEDKFNYKDWETFVSKSGSKNTKTKLFVGLPGSSKASGSGYLDLDLTKELVCKFMDEPHFGGISLWDAARSSENVIEGKSYNMHVASALKCGCSGGTWPPTISTTTTPGSSKTKTYGHETTKPTHKPDEDDVCEDEDDEEEEEPKETYSHTRTRRPTYTRPGKPTYTHHPGKPSGTHGGHGHPTITRKPHHYTTSTVYDTKTYTITSCPPTVPHCPIGKVTETVSVYTTVYPVDDEEDYPEPTGKPSPTSHGKPDYECDGDCDFPEGEVEYTTITIPRPSSNGESPTYPTQPAVACSGRECNDSKGNDSEGDDSKGSDSKGNDSKGNDFKGNDSKGNDSKDSAPVPVPKPSAAPVDNSYKNKPITVSGAVSSAAISMFAVFAAAAVHFL